MSNLLINESPIAFLPTLAIHVGVDGALVLQQIHYWITNPKVGRTADERKWVRNSLNEWRRDNFPFWSESKISRVLTKLEEDGFIISRDDLNRHGYDRTKWYTIHYGNLQNCRMQLAELQDAACENDTTIPETTPETTQKNNSSSHGSDFRAAVIAWENEIHPTLTPIISNDILAAVNEYGSDTVIEAIGIAAKSGKRTWRYIAGILNNWRVSGRNGHSNGTHKNEQPAKQNDDGSYYF